VRQLKRVPNWNRLRLEAYISGLAAAAIAIHLTLRYAVGAPPPVAELPLIVAIIAGGLPLIVQLTRSMAQGNFGTSLLPGVSIATATFLGEYLVACVVMLTFASGRATDRFATKRASTLLAALAKRTPRIAHRSLASRFADISLDEIVIGDWLLVLPREICPADGTVIEGHGTMDECYLTGEPFLNSKTPGSAVLSGAINGDSPLTIAVDKLPADSRLAKITQVVSDSERNRPRLRRLAYRLGAWYTPLALTVAFAAWWFAKDWHRFLAVLVIATPSPLLLAIPIAIIGAISAAGKSGILIKDPRVLEQADRCRPLIFDKTGTVTHGRPLLTEIVATGFDPEQALLLAASLERYSKHPLAGAILRSAEEKRLKLSDVRLISENPGQGLRGLVGDHDVRISGRELLPGEEAAEGLECLLFVDGQSVAAFRFSDEPRKEVYAGKSPEQTLTIVREETKRGKTLYVGDGINDAAAMSAATVGVAVGRQSDITAVAAGAVLLEPSLAKVDELMHISRRMRRIALESALGGIALSAIGMAAAAAGYLPPLVGAVAQEFIDLAAVLNALRATRR
jgi:P-type E1-E2 ATPase